MDWTKVIEGFIANGLGSAVLIVGGIILLYKVTGKKDVNNNNNELKEALNAMSKQLDFIQIEQSHISNNQKEMLKLQNEIVTQQAVTAKILDRLSEQWIHQQLS